MNGSYVFLKGCQMTLWPEAINFLLNKSLEEESYCTEQSGNLTKSPAAKPRATETYDSIIGGRFTTPSSWTFLEGVDLSWRHG